MIRNVICDWSGTLVDDLPAVWQTTNHLLEKAGIPTMSLDQFRAEFCLPFQQFYDRFTPHIPMAQLEEWYHAHFRTAQESVVALPYAREFLEYCRAAGIRTFALSTVHADHFAAQSATTGLGGFFERPYVQVMDKRLKIRDVLEENRLAPEETLFVGDMEHDIETARHGGVFSCAVLTGYNSLAQLRAANPDLVVEHLGELQGILERAEFPFRAGGGSGSCVAPIPTVGGLIFDREGRVLMIRTHKWSDRWGIPGGKIKSGEAAEAALKREIREETGLEIGDVEFVLVQDCIDSPEFYRRAHFVLLNYTCRCLGMPRVVLNEEAQRYEWVIPERALEMDLNRPTRVLLEAVLKREAERTERT